MIVIIFKTRSDLLTHVDTVAICKSYNSFHFLFKLKFIFNDISYLAGLWKFNNLLLGNTIPLNRITNTQRHKTTYAISIYYTENTESVDTMNYSPPLWCTFSGYSTFYC